MPDTFIEECVFSKAVVTIITINGFQMRGTIIAEERSHLVILSDGKKRLVYKHAISTIYA